MTEVYFVNDTSGVTNWGSQATTKALRSLIAESDSNIAYTKYTKGSYQYERNPLLPPSAYLPKVVSDLAKHGSKLDPKRMYLTLQEMGDAVPKVYSQFDDYAKAAISGGALSDEINAIESSDVVLINVEGYGHGAGRATLTHFFLAYLAKEYLDTDCIMVNVTFDPLQDALQEIAENVFPKLDEVVFREPLSAKQYAHLSDNYRVGADPVYASETDKSRDRLVDSFKRNQLDIRPYSTNDFDPSQPYICVAGNSIFANELRHKEAGYSGIRNDIHIEGYRAICRQLKEVCPQIVLVVSSANDELVLSSIADELDLYIAGLNISINDSIRLLANAEVYVGGRYHPTIFSSMGAVPIIPISAVSHKIKGVLELLEVDSPIFDPFDLVDAADDIADLAEKYTSDTTRFDHLPTKVQELSDAATKNVEYLRSREETPLVT